MALTADTQPSPPAYHAVLLVPPEAWPAVNRLITTSGLTTTRVPARDFVPRYELTQAPARLKRGLSAREVAVIELMAEGLQNPEIATQLDMSVDTVKTHSKHIYRKLNAKSRAHAIHLAYQRGILGGDS